MMCRLFFCPTNLHPFISSSLAIAMTRMPITAAASSVGDEDNELAGPRRTRTNPSPIQLQVEEERQLLFCCLRIKIGKFT